MAEDEIQQSMREVIRVGRDNQRQIDDLTAAVGRLVKAIEQDDHFRERSERAEAEERDKRHKQIADAVEDLTTRFENLASHHRDMPGTMLQHIEKKIYELRTARWEALQAGRETTPSFGTQLPGAAHRENTGKIAVALARADDTRPFARAHRDGEPRNIQEIVGGGAIWIAQKSWKLVLTAGASGGLIQLLHKLGVL